MTIHAGVPAEHGAFGVSAHWIVSRGGSLWLMDGTSQKAEFLVRSVLTTFAKFSKARREFFAWRWSAAWLYR